MTKTWGNLRGQGDGRRLQRRIATLHLPFCEAHELRPFGHNSARCEDCGGMLSGALLRALGGIAGLPDAVGRHACDRGHPEMRLLPDRVYRCPACGSEVVPAWRNHRKP